MAEPPRAVLVTGAAKRIGRAVALDLGHHGWDVVVHYDRSAAEAEEVAAEIRGLGRQAVALAADLAREEEAQALVPRANQELGPLTALVNNASVFEHDSVATARRQSWDHHVEINLRAPFVLIQAFAGQLPAGLEGNVVNIIDQRVWNLTPEFVSYTISKTGLWTLTKTLALALAPEIRVNGVGPGPTLPSGRQTAAQFEAQCRSMPLGRGTTPAEICAAIRYILAAPAMTGQMIALDGGQHLARTRTGPGGQIPQIPE
ncbi:MAG: SDR family oxidoreductase [Alphaproteobacteria bacterium]|nr:SDR family oxidoreductase [Alphaproteobacteria bacterium]